MIPIVDIRDLYVRFTGERVVNALNGVDIALAEGEVLGLLGEFGFRQERHAQGAAAHAAAAPRGNRRIDTRSRAGCAGDGWADARNPTAAASSR